MALVGLQDYIAGTAFASASADIAAAVAGARSIRQIVSAVYQDTFSTTSVAFVTITGFAVTITPASSSSQILVFGHINLGATAAGNCGINLLCNNVQIYPNNVVAGRYSGWSLNVAANTSTNHLPFVFLHRPTAIGPQTYTMQAKNNAANTLFINRNGDDTANAGTSYRAASSITAIEIVV